ncbi:MAG TPA: PhzF family phenazine biosynthesis protein [Sphingomicrobium sp.]|nr:PhzF family phenazine biosynthesis protein [Sphingomicrobium sp.]
MRAWLVDAFTSKPLAGGPAYVVEPFATWPDTTVLQQLATEFAQPETAFLRHNDGGFDIRWFTPTHEVNLCGHATLAAAHVLVSELGHPCWETDFDYVDGRLSARRTDKGYELDFPSDEPHRIDPPDGLAELLGNQEMEVWAGRQYLCARLASEDAVRAFSPARGALERVAPDHGCEPGSLVITSLADAGQPYDVVSRFFAPLFGIPEDPVTGSAHCMLMPLYAAIVGRTRLRFHQAYPGRGGDLDCEVVGERVILRGAARTTMRGNVEWNGMLDRAEAPELAPA